MQTAGRKWDVGQTQQEILKALREKFGLDPVSKPVLSAVVDAILVLVSFAGALALELVAKIVETCAARWGGQGQPTAA